MCGRSWRRCRCIFRVVSLSISRVLRSGMSTAWLRQCDADAVYCQIQVSVVEEHQLGAAECRWRSEWHVVHGASAKSLLNVIVIVIVIMIRLYWCWLCDAVWSAACSGRLAEKHSTLQCCRGQRCLHLKVIYFILVFSWFCCWIWLACVTLLIFAEPTRSVELRTRDCWLMLFVKLLVTTWR